MRSANADGSRPMSAICRPSVNVCRWLGSTSTAEADDLYRSAQPLPPLGGKAPSARGKEGSADGPGGPSRRQRGDVPRRAA